MSTKLRVRKFILLDIKAVSVIDGSIKWLRGRFRRPILSPGSPGFCCSTGALDLKDLGPSFFAFREEGSQPHLQALHHRRIEDVDVNSQVSAPPLVYTSAGMET